MLSEESGAFYLIVIKHTCTSFSDNSIFFLPEKDLCGSCVSEAEMIVTG